MASQPVNRRAEQKEVVSVTWSLFLCWKQPFWSVLKFSYILMKWNRSSSQQWLFQTNNALKVFKVFEHEWWNIRVLHYSRPFIQKSGSALLAKQESTLCVDKQCSCSAGSTKNPRRPAMKRPADSAAVAHVSRSWWRVGVTVFVMAWTELT